ncbi:MAG: divergent polysaccharide deacetylase family protein [Parashewanella sp.]
MNLSARIIIFASFLLCSVSTQAAKLALIIDDIGYKQTDHRVFELPKEVTLAILPFTPQASHIARKAHLQGHEIMLHLPMQALNGKRLGKGGLDNGMNDQQIRKVLSAALTEIPYAKGANNHMGSLLTQLTKPMHSVMSFLRQNGLYFIDSRTTKFSKAKDVAYKHGVPNMKRQFFLDNSVKQVDLEKQFSLMLTRAKREQQLIVIAHPHTETMQFLKENLHKLDKLGVKLVPVSKLITRW